MAKARSARFPIGAVVKHRLFPFRGVVFDIDPEFANTEEWYAAIPAEVRPRKDQPFYHLFAENAETEYVAYVSEQNLLPDESGEPVRHPQVKQTFERAKDGSYRPRRRGRNKAYFPSGGGPRDRSSQRSLCSFSDPRGIPAGLELCVGCTGRG